MKQKNAGLTSWCSR